MITYVNYDHICELWSHMWIMITCVNYDHMCELWSHMWIMITYVNYDHMCELWSHVWIMITYVNYYHVCELWSHGTCEVQKNVVKFYLFLVRNIVYLSWLYLCDWVNIYSSGQVCWSYRHTKWTELCTVLFWANVLILKFRNENKVRGFVADSYSQGRLTLLHFCDNYAPVCLTLQLYVSSSRHSKCLFFNVILTCIVVNMWK